MSDMHWRHAVYTSLHILCLRRRTLPRTGVADVC